MNSRLSNTIMLATKIIYFEEGFIMVTKMCFRVNDEKVFDEEIVSFTYITPKEDEEKLGIREIQDSQSGKREIQIVQCRCDLRVLQCRSSSAIRLFFDK